jgi:hypothetical protein
MTHTELRKEGFDFFCYHLLCRALEDKAKFAIEHECVFFMETISSKKFTVYFVGVRKKDRLTRKERGINARGFFQANSSGELGSAEGALSEKKEEKEDG